jgi:regulator of sigma E protease
VREAPERELRLQIERDGVRFDRFVTPRKNVVKNLVGEQEARGLLGVYPWVYAPQIGITDTESPAHAEGLQTGDIITSVNGEPVETIEGLEKELERSRDGALRLTYLRPRAARGEFGRYLWFDSYHARLLPRHERGQSTGLLPANTFIRTVEPGSPAATAGLAPGDRVLAVGDRPVTRWETIEALLGRQGEQPQALTVQSPGQAPRVVTVTQVIRSYRGIYKQEQKQLWFGAEPYRSRSTPAPEPIRGRFTYAARSALDETGSMLTMMWTSLRQMVTGQRGVEELSSVVGIFNVAGTAAEQGPGPFLLLMAVLSINLGFVNLLPIPILDGGHLMFFTIEALRRRPLSQRAREIASAVGLAIILLLLLIALRNDVMRWMN